MKKCVNCQQEFEPKSGKQKFCSDKCKVAASRAKKKIDINTLIAATKQDTSPYFISSTNADEYGSPKPVFDNTKLQNRINELKTQKDMPLKDTFQYFLDQFHKIIKGMPAIAKISQELSNLRLSATNNHDLSFHQREAITARCDNYLKNDYGTQRNDQKQVEKMEQFQKMRSGKMPGNFSSNGNGK